MPAQRLDEKALAATMRGEVAARVQARADAGKRPPGLAAVLVARAGGKAVRMDSAVPFGTLLAIAAYPAWLFLLWSPR